MRVNARFEGVAEQQVEYLAKTTGLKVSDVLRDSVDFYYRHIRSHSGSGLRHLGALIGQGDSGRTDISVNYKEILTEILSEKYGLSVPVAKPSNPTNPGKDDL